MEDITVEISNWHKYNARTDRVNYTWFRFENSFFTSQDMFSLNPAQRVLFIFLLCEASKKNNAVVNIKIDFVSFLLKTDGAKIIKDIKYLNTVGVVKTSQSRHDDVSTPPDGGFTPHTYSTDSTDERNSTIHTSGLDDFVKLWNDTCDKLPKVIKLSDSRRKTLKARLTENSDLEYWKNVITKMAASNFCNGTGGNGWVADFDFLIKPDTHIRVMEGKYDNRGAQTKNEQTSQKNMDQYERIEKGLL